MAPSQEIILIIPTSDGNLIPLSLNLHKIFDHHSTTVFLQDFHCPWMTKAVRPVCHKALAHITKMSACCVISKKTLNLLYVIRRENILCIQTAWKQNKAKVTRKSLCNFFSFFLNKLFCSSFFFQVDILCCEGHPIITADESWPHV